MPTTTPSPAEQFIEAAQPERRAELRTLHELVRKAVPEYEPVVADGLLGYGRFHYRYASGREGDAFRVSIANTKTGIAIYILAADEKGYLAEQAAPRLGKVKVGRSCIRFKVLAGVNLDVLAEVIARTRETGGAGEAAQGDRC